MSYLCMESGEVFDEEEAEQHSKNKHRKPLEDAVADELMKEVESVGTFRANVDGKIKNLKKLRKQIEDSKFFETIQTSEDKLKVYKVNLSQNTKMSISCSKCRCP